MHAVVRVGVIRCDIQLCPPWSQMANCKASGFLRLRGLVPWSVWPRGRVASQDCGRGPHVAPCRAYQGLRQVVYSSAMSGLCPGLVCCLVWPVSNELVLIEMPVHTLALIGVFEITTSSSAHVDQRCWWQSSWSVVGYGLVWSIAWYDLSGTN